jgi:hypothetical protein
LNLLRFSFGGRSVGCGCIGRCGDEVLSLGGGSTRGGFLDLSVFLAFDFG